MILLSGRKLLPGARWTCLDDQFRRVESANIYEKL